MSAAACAWCAERGYAPGDASLQTGLRGARVVVLGSSGLIGSALVDYLVHLNDHNIVINVVAVGRSIDRLASRFASSEHLRLLEWDVSSDAAPAQLGDATYIVHAASNATPATIIADPVGTMAANINGTMRALDAARVASASFLLVSSSEVYGRIDTDDAITENMQGVVPLNLARSSYPVSKRAAETLVASYINQHGVRANIVRPGFVFGPQIGRWDDRVIPQFVRSARSGSTIEMKSDGLLRRSYIYVSDCVTAMLRVMLDAEPGAAFNIANPDCDVTIREIAETVADEGGTSVEFANPSDADLRGRSAVASGLLDSAALQALGWVPRVNMRTGLALTFNRFEEVK